MARAPQQPRLAFALFASKPSLSCGAAVRDRCTGGIACNVAGHISPVLAAGGNNAAIQQAYRWGPAQSQMATANPDSPMPIFLSFEPYVRKTPHSHHPPTPSAAQPQTRIFVQVGWEEERLWRKGYTWAGIMGLGWLPIIGCMALWCAASGGTR